MGHKVHPTGFRLGVIKGWESRWYADRNYKDLFAEDRKLRDYIRKRLANASVSRIEIERVAGTQIAITIHTAKPGIVIGKSGESVDRLRHNLEAMTKKKVRLSILEIRNPEIDAYLVARSIADQLEKRVSFRRAMKQAVQKAMRGGAKGIKVTMGGRLGGAEIARTEKESEGSVPLQTLRADIDYGLAEAHTTYGVIGVKVWIYHGDILPEQVGQERPSARQPVEAGVGAGERPAARGSRGGRSPRAASERGPRGGERNMAPRGPRTGEKSTLRGGSDQGGSRRVAHPVRPAAAGPTPEGEIPAEKGPDMPNPGAVTPAPAAHEFPAPVANEAAQASQAELGTRQPEQTNETNESGS